MTKINQAKKPIGQKERIKKILRQVEKYPLFSNANPNKKTCAQKKADVGDVEDVGDVSTLFKSLSVCNKLQIDNEHLLAIEKYFQEETYIGRRLYCENNMTQEQKIILFKDIRFHKNPYYYPYVHEKNYLQRIDIAYLKTFIAVGGDVNQSSQYGLERSFLYEAIGYQDEEAVRLLLLVPNIVVNQPDFKGMLTTPLHFCVTIHPDCAGIMQILLQSEKIDPNTIDSSGQTPLHQAVVEGNIVAIKHLLASEKVDANKCDNDGETPLQVAMTQGDDEIINLLLVCEQVKR